MSPRKSIKKPAQEIEATEIESTETESTEPVQIESTEDNPEIQATDDQSVEITGAAEIEVHGEDHPGDLEILPDSDAQTEEPISEVAAEQVADVNGAEVTDPVTTDPEPESTPTEGHNAPLVADTGPMATTPVPEATDAPVAPTSGRDPRLPPVGSVITRKYKDRDLQVTVLESGFEFEGAVYKSLSKLAATVSGQICNGFAFFKLTGSTGTPSAKTPKAARQATKPAGDKLADKIAKIDALIVNLRAALDEGAAALAEAEAKRAEMVGTADPTAG